MFHMHILVRQTLVSTQPVIQVTCNKLTLCNTRGMQGPSLFGTVQRYRTSKAKTPLLIESMTELA
jgi:hypothetical protein